MTDTILKYQQSIMNDNMQAERLSLDELIDEYFSKSYGLDDPAQVRFYEKSLRSEL